MPSARPRGPPWSLRESVASATSSAPETPTSETGADGDHRLGEACECSGPDQADAGSPPESHTPWGRVARTAVRVARAAVGAVRIAVRRIQLACGAVPFASRAVRRAIQPSGNRLRAFAIGSGKAPSRMGRTPFRKGGLPIRMGESPWSWAWRPSGWGRSPSGAG